MGNARGDGVLVNAIGVTSITLGAAMIGAPDVVLVAAGVRPTPGARLVLRARGVSELAQGLGILARRQPSQLLRSRVIGDVADLGALALAGTDPQDPRRLRIAAAAVGAVAAADIIATRRCVAASDRPASAGGRGSLAALTVNLPIAEVAERTDELETLGQVELTPAPGERGTEVRIDVTAKGGIRRGLLGSGRSRERALVELRRFKQRLELGDVVRSDGAPEGPTMKRQLLQRAGQPPS